MSEPERVPSASVEGRSAVASSLSVHTPNQQFDSTLNPYALARPLGLSSPESSSSASRVVLPPISSLLGRDGVGLSPRSQREEGALHPSPALTRAQLDALKAQLSEGRNPLASAPEAAKFVNSAIDLDSAQATTANKLTHAQQLIRSLNKTLSELETCSKDELKLERDRFVVESAQWRASAQALARKVNQTRLNAVYTQPTVELEARNKQVSRIARLQCVSFANQNLSDQLESDVRHLTRRLRQAEGDSAHAEREVRALRAAVLHGAPLIATDAEIDVPAPHNPFDSSPRRRSRRGWRMGDAEAEHLILAGKRLSHVRRIERVGLDRAIVRQAEEIVSRSRQGGLGLESEEEDELDDDEGDYEVDDYGVVTPKPQLNTIRRPSAATAKSGRVTPPPSIRRVDVSPSRTGPRTAYSSVHATPGATRRELGSIDASGGFDNLLHAAHVLGEDVASPTARHAALLSLPSSASTNRSSRSPETDPRKRRRSPGSDWRPSSGVALQGLQREDEADESAHPSSDSYLSALEVLAEASASHDPSSSDVEFFSTPRKRARKNSNDDSHSSPLAPTSTPAVPAPAPTANRLAGPAVILIPPKPERAPYIKWNVDEDEDLVKAVLAHGLRWDQVASAVPSRSYHQVRQRFLRGLKSGETLPVELHHYQPQLLKAVKDYEVLRKSKQSPVKASREEADELNEEQR